jgi:prohibitin 2
MPEPKNILVVGAIAILGLLGLAIVSAGYYQIDGSERGVMITGGVPGTFALQPGPGVKMPFYQNVDYFSIQTQKYTATAGAASKDLQDVQTQVTVNYHLDPDKVAEIYIALGHNYEDKVIQPAVQEVVKAVTAKFDASELVTRRGEVKTQVEQGIQARLAPYNLILDPNGVSLTDFKYSEEFTKAVEAKVTAYQYKQKADNDLARIKVEAQQKMAQAEADQKYASPDMIRLKQLEVQQQAIGKWNGVMPTIMTGGNNAQGIVPFMNIEGVK